MDAGTCGGGGGTSCQGSWTFTGDPQWHHAMVVVVFDATFGQASLFVHGEDLGLTSGAAFPYGASILAGDHARAGTCGGVPAARVLLLLGPGRAPAARASSSVATLRRIPHRSRAASARGKNARAAAPIDASASIEVPLVTPPRPVLPARQPPAAKAGFTARPERRSPVGCNVRLQLPAAALTP